MREMNRSDYSKIVLVDDCKLFRQGIRLILEKENNVEIVGEASNPENLFKLLDTTKIDLIVISLLLPKKSVLAICEKMTKNYSGIPFLILTVRPIENAILECVMNVAHGLIWKDGSPEQLMEAIRTITSGERYLSPESLITTQVIQHAYNEHSNSHDFNELSNREQEVLKLFAEGLSYKEIGLNLGISPRTVESHKNNILAKLNLTNVNEMIKYAIKHGLILL